MAHENERCTNNFTRCPGSVTRKGGKVSSCRYEAERCCLNLRGKHRGNRKWVHAYHRKGMAGLQKRKRGRRHGGQLKKHQATTIGNLIRDRDPEQLKLPFYLWTAKAVDDLIYRKYKIRYSIRHVQRLLSEWGFTPQKPKRVAYEQNPENVRKWLDEVYPSIEKQAKREKARIFWGDEMGARSDYQAGRSYAPRGVTPVVNGTGKRFGCNVISAITNRGDISFMVFKRKFTSIVFMRFLKKLVKSVKERKIFIIVDSHPVHRSGAISR